MPITLSTWMLQLLFAARFLILTVVSVRGRLKELLPPNVRFLAFCHENESCIILFKIMVEIYPNPFIDAGSSEIIALDPTPHQG